MLLAMMAKKKNCELKIKVKAVPSRSHEDSGDGGVGMEC
jgi:hypothetical protein